MPVATVLSGVIDFVLAFVVLVAMMVYYRMAPSPNVVWLPLFLLLALIAALGTGPVALGDERPVPRRALHGAVPHAVLAVRHADRVSQLAAARAVADDLRPQPDGRRRRRLPLGAVRHARAPVAVVAVSFASAALVLVSGALYFRRMERTFADIV